jgi:hypothetical protein
MFNPANAPDPDHVYRNYLRSCSISGIEPVPRECALGLLQEWTAVLSSASRNRDAQRRDGYGSRPESQLPGR